MIVVDASAVLAYLQGEAGADVVRSALAGRLQLKVLTADREWFGRAEVIPVR